MCIRDSDWSERRSHLGGALGAALLQQIVDVGWARRTDGRVMVISAAGAAGLSERLGVRVAAS